MVGACGYHRPAPALNAPRIRSGAVTVRWIPDAEVETDRRTDR